MSTIEIVCNNRINVLFDNDAKKTLHYTFIYTGED